MEKSNLSTALTITSFKLEKQNLRMQGIISHLHALETLLRQGVPIRGDTDEDSNIYQFNLDQAVTDSGLKLLLKEKHYVLAHDIHEEQKQMVVLEAGEIYLKGFDSVSSFRFWLTSHPMLQRKTSFLFL